MKVRPNRGEDNASLESKTHRSIRGTLNRLQSNYLARGEGADRFVHVVLATGLVTIGVTAAALSVVFIHKDFGSILDPSHEPLADWYFPLAFLILLLPIGFTYLAVVSHKAKRWLWGAIAFILVSLSLPIGTVYGLGLTGLAALVALPPSSSRAFRSRAGGAVGLVAVGALAARLNWEYVLPALVVVTLPWHFLINRIPETRPLRIALRLIRRMQYATPPVGP